MAKANVKTDFWHSRRGNLSIAIVLLVAMYLMASRAIQTGSLQQYGLTILLFGFAISRSVHAIHK